MMGTEVQSLMLKAMTNVERQLMSAEVELNSDEESGLNVSDVAMMKYVWAVCEKEWWEPKFNRTTVKRAEC